MKLGHCDVNTHMVMLDIFGRDVLPKMNYSHVNQLVLFACFQLETITIKQVLYNFIFRHYNFKAYLYLILCMRQQLLKWVLIIYGRRRSQLSKTARRCNMTCLEFGNKTRAGSFLLFTCLKECPDKYCRHLNVLRKQPCLLCQSHFGQR